MNKPAVGVVIAVIVSCVSAAVAVMLIIGSLTLNARTVADSTDAAGTPTPPAPTSQNYAPSSPASTLTPYEQLKGQMLAILEADGAQKAYELLAGAIDASPDAAPLCRRVVVDLKAADPSLDWASACK